MEQHIILAKRPQNPGRPAPQETLFGHSKAVMQSFKIMFGISPQRPTRLGKQWLRFFKLEAKDFERFFMNGWLACGLHDLGKANNGFQDMVNNGRGVQAIWHEHLSGLLLRLPPLREWLKNFGGIDEKILLSAIIGHHLRADQRDFAESLHPDIKMFKIFPEAIGEVLDEIGAQTERCPKIQGEFPLLWNFIPGNGFELGKLRETIKRELYIFRRELKEGNHLHRLLLAVRAALIQADSAGSGIVRKGKDIQEWLSTAFDGILNSDYIHENVIVPRIQEIKEKKGDFIWGDFQDAAEGLPERALLLAPCGSGKTLAAWRWIKGRLTEKPAARVIFLYPTRGTATEGFRDYVSWAPEADAGLIHGTAEYELDGMFDNPDDGRYGKDFSQEDRMFSLGFWHRRVFSATVDQFLGFMQQVYRSICLLPLLVDSVIVIDEVHSFDRALFSALKLFLKAFDIPVLCMTASLPPARQNDLKECGLEVFPQDIRRFTDLEVQATLPRYLVEQLEDREQAQDMAFQALDRGKRVLWVVNTVTRCQELARTLNGICYHSRFTLEDRKNCHKAVIAAFQESHGPILAITTQVCEMSLDLDAQILISEVAPITSLIQRMGRCNRHAGRQGGEIGIVYFYAPEDVKPYQPDDLVGCEEFLKEVSGQGISQIQLEELLDKYGPCTLEPERYAAFIESGPWAKAREERLREDREFTVNAILSKDIGKYFKCQREKKPIDGLILPVPRKFARQDPRLGRYLQTAAESHYSSKYGFFDHPLETII